MVPILAIRFCNFAVKLRISAFQQVFPALSAESKFSSNYSQWAMPKTSLKVSSKSGQDHSPGPAQTFSPKVGVLVGLLIGVTLAAYLPTFRAEFLPFDDQEYVYLNPNVADGFSVDSIVWAFTKVSVSNWHPLTWLSHMLDSQLFGLDPHKHHAVNIAWHALNAVSLFLVTRYLTGQTVPSFIVSLLFALHPTHVEVVGWVAQRKTLISTFLILLTIAAYATYIRRSSWRWYFMSLLLFAVCLMAKQTFVTLPLLLILIDFWPLQRISSEGTAGIQYWKVLLRQTIHQLPDKIPYAVIGFAAALLTMLAQTDAMQSLDSFPVADRLGNVCIAYCRYLAGIFWPSPLSIYYTIHLEKITLLAIAASLGAIVLLSVLSLMASRRFPYLLTGWYWFLISMLPVIGIVHVGSQSMADRYLYNASFGVFLTVVWFCWDMLGKVEARYLSGSKSRSVARASSAIIPLLVALGLAWETHRRCERWQTVLGTFQEAIAQDSTNWLAHRVLAEKHIDLREYEKAVFHARAALETYEDSGFYVLQAIAHREMDERPEAAHLLARAIELNPDDALAYSLMAIIRSELGQSQEVQTLLDTAEQKAELPKNQIYRRVRSLILRNCGIALFNENRPLDALQRFEAAQEWDARDEGLVQEAAEAELKLGRVDQAVARLELVYSDHPDNLATIGLLGRALKQAGRFTEAEGMLRRALEIEPADTMSALQLANLLLTTGRAIESEGMLLASIAEVISRKDSKEKERWLAELNSQLGDVHLATRNLPGAVESYRLSLVHWPDQFSAGNNLAWLMATESDETVRNPEEAVRLAEHACQLPGAREKGCLGTLAAAYAAAGRIEEAVQTAQEALQIAETEGNPAAIDQLRQQLQVHRSGKALFESSVGK